jgi:hypothetical protein
MTMKTQNWLWFLINLQMFAQERFWRVSNSSRPTWKWTTLLDTVFKSLQFGDENIHHAHH